MSVVCVCKCVSVVHFKFRCNILISGNIVKQMPGSVASGTTYISCHVMHDLLTVDDAQMQTPMCYGKCFLSSLHVKAESTHDAWKERSGF